MNDTVRGMLRAVTPHGVVEWRRRRGTDGRVAVESVPLNLPTQSLDQLLPNGIPEAIHLPGAELLRSDFMVSPLRELAVIGAICRALAPRHIFEFGTYIGSATRVMAMNCQASIVTLDIDSATRERLYGAEAAEALYYTCGAAFMGTGEQARITQVLGDSRSFDYKPYLGLMDLVFVDANHSCDYVRNDSEWALGLLRPGGAVLWDDYIYTAEHPECRGVAQYVNELSRRMACYRIEGTRLAIGFPSQGRHD